MNDLQEEQAFDLIRKVYKGKLNMTMDEIAELTGLDRYEMMEVQCEVGESVSFDQAHASQRDY